MKSKENLPLIIGTVLPFLMVIFVAASIYLPKIFADKPKYDFIYGFGNFDFADHYYEVVDGRLTKIYRATSLSEDDYRKIVEESQLYMHGVETNESAKISFEEAQEFVLDDSTESPDAFIVERGSGGGLFGPSNWNKHYLKGHGTSKKLNLANRGDYYNFHFIGWIIEDNE